MSDHDGYGEFLSGVRQGQYGSGGAFPSSIENAMGRLWSDIDRAAETKHRPTTDFVPAGAGKYIGSSGRSAPGYTESRWFKWFCTLLKTALILTLVGFLAVPVINATLASRKKDAIHTQAAKHTSGEDASARRASATRR